MANVAQTTEGKLRTKLKKAGLFILYVSLRIHMSNLIDSRESKNVFSV